MENSQILASSTQNPSLKQSDEVRKVSNEKIREIFLSFMTTISNLDELVDAANKFLAGFQQALDFLRRPSIDMSNVVLERLVKANTTRGLSSYIEAGCFNVHDSMENISKSMSVVKELESLLHDAEEVVQITSQDNDDDLHLKSYLSPFSQEKVPSSILQKPEITDYAILMAFMYWMVKKDHEMQAMVVSALGLKSSSEELGSYCLMWSLRPYIKNEVIVKAWSHIR